MTSIYQYKFFDSSFELRDQIDQIFGGMRVKYIKAVGEFKIIHYIAHVDIIEHEILSDKFKAIPEHKFIKSEEIIL